MKKGLIPSDFQSTGLSALAGIALCVQGSVAAAQFTNELQITKTGVEQGKYEPLQFGKRSNVSYGSYIIGPGDSLEIDLLDLPELSGRFSIGPDGTLYLPRLRALYVEGLTLEELREFLTQKYGTYVRNPQVYIRPVVYRPIRIYVGGEVKRPGYYTLSGDTNLRSQQLKADTTRQRTRPDLMQIPGRSRPIPIRSSVKIDDPVVPVFPTVFDAIRSAQGVTPYSDLAKVQVTRKRAEGLGGGRMRTSLNFLSLITEGDETQNIRLFDGDVLNIGRSHVALRDQLLKAGQTNLSPLFMEVFVTGRVNIPGGIKIPQGGTLNQAILLAGGTKLLKGRIEFVRFNREGTVDRRIFGYQPGASAGTPNNPILADGDLIRVQNSILTSGFTVLNEVTAPFIGIYSFYSIFNGLSR